MGSSFKPPHSCSLSIPSAFILLPEILRSYSRGQVWAEPQKAIIMMPYLSCKNQKMMYINFPTWQYCKYKDIFDSRIIINSTAKILHIYFYQKDLLSIDTSNFYTLSSEIAAIQLSPVLLVLKIFFQKFLYTRIFSSWIPSFLPNFLPCFTPCSIPFSIPIFSSLSATSHILCTPLSF